MDGVCPKPKTRPKKVTKKVQKNFIFCELFSKKNDQKWHTFSVTKKVKNRGPQKNESLWKSDPKKATLFLAFYQGGLFNGVQN